MLDRYDELLAPSLSDPARLRRVTAEAGQVILTIDGLQTDVGHEVLRVIRDVLSGEILLGKSLLPSCRADLAKLLTEVKAALHVEGAAAVPFVQSLVGSPTASISFATWSLRRRLTCRINSASLIPSQGARTVNEANRHAKVTLKKKLRRERLIEWAVEGRDDDEARASRGYCSAVRTSLMASGLVPRARLPNVTVRLDEVASKRSSPTN